MLLLHIRTNLICPVGAGLLAEEHDIPEYPSTQYVVTMRESRFQERKYFQATYGIIVYCCDVCVTLQCKTMSLIYNNFEKIIHTRDTLGLLRL